MKRLAIFTFVVLVTAAAFPQATLTPASTPALKPVTVFLEGDSSVIPKMINVCRQFGPEYGLDFKFVDKKEDKYDYRVILSAEGSSMWDWSHGNIVVMNPETKVLFTVTRANRWTAKGAVNALTKEFVKVLARYVGTHA